MIGVDAAPDDVGATNGPVVLGNGDAAGKVRASYGVDAAVAEERGLIIPADVSGKYDGSFMETLRGRDVSASLSLIHI